MIFWIVIIIIAYLMGSIPFGIIMAGYFSGKDITKEGSGNIGATNVARVVGKKAGILTLLLDALKGAVPVLIATGSNSPLVVALTAIAAFAGHLWPVFNAFKGGKGVATALGIFLVISPKAAIASVLIFVLVLLLWHYVSLGSITAAYAMPALMGILSEPPSLIAAALLIGGLVIIRHKDNIGRLLDGTENRMGSKKD